MRTETIVRQYGLATRLICFPLHPETPEQGQSLEDLFGGHLNISAMLERLSQVAANLELPFGARSYTYNSRRAQELGKWAEQQGAGAAFHDAVYRAYFAEGRNIAQPEVLLTIVGNLGLSEVDAATALNERTGATEVDADWQHAQQLGVTAVPTLIYQGRRLVGFSPEEDYRRLILGD